MVSEVARCNPLAISRIDDMFRIGFPPDKRDYIAAIRKGSCRNDCTETTIQSVFGDDALLNCKMGHMANALIRRNSGCPGYA